MKKIIISVIVVVLFGATFYVLQYKHTPLQTMNKLEKAINEHDWATFQEYVDIDGVYNSFMGDALAEADNSFAKGLGMLMADKMKTVFKNKLKEAIEDTETKKSNIFSGLINKISQSDGELTIKKYGKISNMIFSDKTEILKIPVKIIFKFSDDGEKYILSAVDTSQLKKARNVEMLLIKDHYNLPVEKEMKSSVAIKSIGKHEGCSNYIGKTCISKLIMNTTKVQNLTSKKIVNVGFYIYPNSTTYKNEKYMRYGSAKNIKANSIKIIGKKTGWKYNQFKESDKVFMKAKRKSLYYEIDEIKFSDDRVLKKGKYLYLEHVGNYPSIKQVLKRRKDYGLSDNHGYELLN